jgi:polynucleotide 5'-hydroxyl-kinase GRC3/NOL9
LNLSGRAVKVRIDRGHTLLLSGPAQVRLREGSAECFGAPIPVDDWIAVEIFRQVPILALETAEFDLLRSSGSSWTDIHESTIATSWSEAAQILQQQTGVAAVVGEVDSGKSSLCTLLANRCAQSGLKVGVVDGDVGQADIGPPATVSSGHVSKSITCLQDLSPERSFFIGDTTPSSATSKIVRSVVGLRDDLVKSCDVVIVNTDGWVSDFGAQRFKQELLEQIRPVLVLGLAHATEIDPLLDPVKSTTLKLPISKHARVRSKDERKKIRETGYRRFLNDSSVLRLARESVRLSFFDQPQQSILQPFRKLRGLLSGLLNENGDLLSIARIREVTSDLLVVETRGLEEPTHVEVGNVVLSSKYEEIGYLTLH